MSQTRRLAAILASDVAGYSRLIEGDEEGTLGRLKALRAEIIDPKIAGHEGRIVKTTGDGLLSNLRASSMRCVVRPSCRRRSLKAMPHCRPTGGSNCASASISAM